MFIKVIQDWPTSHWKDCTLVLPAVSVGNVGQLAMDLLISTLWMDKVGYFYDDSVLPIAGNDPYEDQRTTCDLVTNVEGKVNGQVKGAKTVTTALEVYECGENRIVAIQQRSPFIKGKMKQYIDKLLSWIQEYQFKDVIILSSSFSQTRLDPQLLGTQQRFLLSAEMELEAGKRLREELQWKELEKRVQDPAMDGLTHLARNGEEAVIYLPGGGIAKSLFEKLCAKNIRAALLLSFVSEGDNTSDALQLATYLNTWRNWIDLKNSAEGPEPSNHPSGWHLPCSWRHTFGSALDSALYG